MFQASFSSGVPVSVSVSESDNSTRKIFSVKRKAANGESKLGNADSVSDSVSTMEAPTLLQSVKFKSSSSALQTLRCPAFPEFASKSELYLHVMNDPALNSSLFAEGWQLVVQYLEVSVNEWPIIFLAPKMEKPQLRRTADGNIDPRSFDSFTQILHFYGTPLSKADQILPASGESAHRTKPPASTIHNEIASVRLKCDYPRSDASQIPILPNGFVFSLQARSLDAYHISHGSKPIKSIPLPFPLPSDRYPSVDGGGLRPLRPCINSTLPPSSELATADDRWWFLANLTKGGMAPAFRNHSPFLVWELRPHENVQDIEIIVSQVIADEHIGNDRDALRLERRELVLLKPNQSQTLQVSNSSSSSSSDSIWGWPSVSVDVDVGLTEAFVYVQFDQCLSLWNPRTGHALFQLYAYDDDSYISGSCVLPDIFQEEHAFTMALARANEGVYFYRITVSQVPVDTNKSGKNYTSTLQELFCITDADAVIPATASGTQSPYIIVKSEDQITVMMIAAGQLELVCNMHGKEFDAIFQAGSESENTDDTGQTTEIQLAFDEHVANTSSTKPSLKDAFSALNAHLAKLRLSGDMMPTGSQTANANLKQSASESLSDTDELDMKNLQSSGSGSATQVSQMKKLEGWFCSRLLPPRSTTSDEKNKEEEEEESPSYNNSDDSNTEFVAYMYEQLPEENEYDWLKACIGTASRNSERQPSKRDHAIPCFLAFVKHSESEEDDRVLLLSVTHSYRRLSTTNQSVSLAKHSPSSLNVTVSNPQFSFTLKFVCANSNLNLGRSFPRYLIPSECVSSSSSSYPKTEEFYECLLSHFDIEQSETRYEDNRETNGMTWKHFSPTGLLLEKAIERQLYFFQPSPALTEEEYEDPCNWTAKGLVMQRDMICPGSGFFYPEEKILKHRADVRKSFR